MIWGGGFGEPELLHVPLGSSNPAIIKIIKRRKTEETILIRNVPSTNFFCNRLVERMMYAFAARTKFIDVVVIATRSKFWDVEMIATQSKDSSGVRYAH